MLNKLLAFIRRYELIAAGDRVICAVSGGADSVAMLFALYLLREKLQITLEAAHFNHCLRAEESDRDEAFVRQLCDRYDILLHLGRGQVSSGEKGLEAAARDARYGFFATLPGKIATAHTADDNAETVLMHMVRGTGLKGLGGISPVRGNVIRPMLTVTRQQVLAFLQEYALSYVTDSTNTSDDFLRNRLRHRVMPVLTEENPRLAQNLSEMALQLRQDEEVLQALAGEGQLPSVTVLREMERPLRLRKLASFLESSGVKEPEMSHILQAETLVFSPKPSAKASFPGGVVLCRKYDRVQVWDGKQQIEPCCLECPGQIIMEHLDLMISSAPACRAQLQTHCFTVQPVGKVIVRSRKPGDRMRLSGGTKSLKEIFIDRKIPADLRAGIPVIADDAGVLGVWGIGANLDRVSSEEGIRIQFIEKRENRS